MLKLPGRVENGNGSCTHKRALQLVKEDGAVAAIVYSALAPGSSPSVPSTLGLDDQYPLTVYWIDTTSAAGLLAAVSSAALGNSTLKASKRYARAILYPTEKFFPGIWEFTLIIVVILLTLSFATSVAMHCHLYRVRRRQDANMAANAASRSQKTLLDKSVLDSFPVYTYSEKDKAAAEMAETSYIELNPADIALPPSVASSTSSLAIREEIIELQAESSQMAYKKSEEFVMKDEDGNLLLTEPATIDANSDILFTHAQLIIPTCAVCLEDFELGDQLRELPCGHRYHTECIDPWLTEKSSACPMCKADFHRPATATEEPTVRSRRQSWFRSEEDTFVNGPRSIFARYRLRRQRQRQQRRSEGNV